VASVATRDSPIQLTVGLASHLKGSSDSTFGRLPTVVGGEAGGEVPHSHSPRAKEAWARVVTPEIYDRSDQISSAKPN